MALLSMKLLPAPIAPKLAPDVPIARPSTVTGPGALPESANSAVEALAVTVPTVSESRPHTKASRHVEARQAQ